MTLCITDLLFSETLCFIIRHDVNKAYGNQFFKIVLRDEPPPCPLPFLPHIVAKPAVVNFGRLPATRVKSYQLNERVRNVQMKMCEKVKKDHMLRGQN